MISPDAGAQAALDSRARGGHWLVELDFSTGTLYYSTLGTDITIDGHAYKGLSSLLQVEGLSESEDGGAQKLTFSVPVVNEAMLAATLGNVETYRGRRARLYLQMFDAESIVPLGAKIHRWTGFMEPINVKRKGADPGGGVNGGRISIPCSRAGMSRARNATGLRLSDAQQQQRFAGDRGLEYIPRLIADPQRWLSVAFQKQD